MSAGFAHSGRLFLPASTPSPDWFPLLLHQGEVAGLLLSDAHLEEKKVDSMCRKIILHIDDIDRAEGRESALLPIPVTYEEEFPSSEYPSQLRTEFVRDFFAETYLGTVPQPVNGKPSQPVLSSFRDQQDRDAFEDYLREIVDSWTVEQQATVYWYLHASGMTLQTATSIRRKAGLTS